MHSIILVSFNWSRNIIQCSSFLLHCEHLHKVPGTSQTMFPHERPFAGEISEPPRGGERSCCVVSGDLLVVRNGMNPSPNRLQGLSRTMFLYVGIFDSVIFFYSGQSRKVGGGLYTPDAPRWLPTRQGVTGMECGPMCSE